ncbi:hypothetical protein [Peptoniphilus indolicus]|uniref:Uncharacterized protein n=1 Tax=Peptoniphilus indolicus TaxID=33030 RepID=A0A379DD35_9FIRM|nr:hypothetical protein [Peptoniphilus indolicus]SUB75807.1 Uncharacterised protein [Peptoniphilus indolicus]
MKKLILITIAFTCIGSFIIYHNKDIVFQKGNPIPYLIAISKIKKEKPYVKLDKNILISKNGDVSYLFKHFENDMGIKFKEQMGSGYIFSDGNKDYLLTSEIYLKKYIVWSIHEEDKY